MTTQDLPPWTLRIDRPLRQAARRVQLLRAATPVNASDERARLGASFASGNDGTPHWVYAPLDLEATERALADVARELEFHRDGTHRALAALYAARAAELGVEAELCRHVGSRELASRGAARFGPFAAATSVAADALAIAWIGKEGVRTEEQLLASDSEDRASLLSRMRAEVGRRRIAFSVVVHAGLPSLAATGDRAILVAAGRLISDEAARRTVVHEIEGHALPRARASVCPLGLVAIGTARSTDEQEGYALVVEHRHGFLTHARRRELAARHLAVRAMRGGASFVETVRMLVREHGVRVTDAIVIAERTYRGSDGTFAGLGRERVYLEAFVRVRDRLAIEPAVEQTLSAGQVSLDAVATLAPYLASWHPAPDLKA